MRLNLLLLVSCFCAYLSNARGHCAEYTCKSGELKHGAEDRVCGRSGCTDEKCCFNGKLPGECGASHKVLICKGCEYGGTWDYRDDPYEVLNDAPRVMGFEIVAVDGPGIFTDVGGQCKDKTKYCMPGGHECKEDSSINKFMLCDSRLKADQMLSKFPFALNVNGEWVLRHISEHDYGLPSECGFGQNKPFDVENLNHMYCGVNFEKSQGFKSRGSGIGTVNRVDPYWSFKKGDKIYPSWIKLAYDAKFRTGASGKEPSGHLAVDVYAIVEHEYEKVLLCEECEYGVNWDHKDDPYQVVNPGVYAAYIYEYVRGPGIQFTIKNGCCEYCIESDNFDPAAKKGNCNARICQNKFNLCNAGPAPFNLIVEGEPVMGWEDGINAMMQSDYNCRNGHSYIVAKDSNTFISDEGVGMQCTLDLQGKTSESWDWTRWLARDQLFNDDELYIYPGDEVYPTTYHVQHPDDIPNKNYLPEFFLGEVTTNVFGIRRVCGDDVGEGGPKEDAVCDAAKYIEMGYTCEQLEGAGWDIGACDCPEPPACASQVYLNQGYTCEQLLNAGFDMAGCQCEDVCQHVCQEYIDQGYSCQECEMAGLKCTPCDECGGCACAKYMDQGYTCAQIEKAGLDCSGCGDACDIHGCMDETAENYNAHATHDDGSCTHPEPEKPAICSDTCKTYLAHYTCDQMREFGYDCTPCGCSACSDTCKEYLGMGQTCEVLAAHGLDCSGCDCSAKCSDSCKQALDHYSCDTLLQTHGLDCSACDCSPKCFDMCKTYLHQGLTCNVLMNAGIDCSACDSCACSQCGAYLSNYSCEDLEGTYGMDCGDCVQCV